MKFKEQKLFDAARRGHARVIRSLLRDGVDIEARDPGGMPKNRTALMIAAENGHLSVVDALIQAGAKLDSKDSGIPLDFPGGNTALILALKNKHETVAERLIEAGAGVKIKGGGTTVLCAAAELGNASLVKRILEGGADPNSRTMMVGSALCCAVVANALGASKLLLEAGADPNATDAGRLPALSCAAFDGLEGACELLLDHGADADLGDADNRMTPLMCASRMDHSKVVAVLLKRGAKVNLVNVRNQTALDIAIDDKSRRCEALLRKAGAKHFSALP